MIAFLIPIKHFQNSNSYHYLWELLNQTLRSILANEGDFHIFIAANKELPFDPDIDTSKVTVKIVNTNPIPINQPTKQDKNYLEHKFDKTTKRLALLEDEDVKSLNPTHFFMMDGDDLLSNRIVKFINKRRKRPVFIIDRGHFYKVDSELICNKEDFNRHCGSSVVLSSKIVYNNMDNWEWSVEWIGRHKIQRTYGDILKVPFYASVYRLHPDCVSAYMFRREGNWRKPTLQETKEFKL